MYGSVIAFTFVTQALYRLRFPPTMLLPSFFYRGSFYIQQTANQIAKPDPSMTYESRKYASFLHIFDSTLGAHLVVKEIQQEDDDDV